MRKNVVEHRVLDVYDSAAGNYRVFQNDIDLRLRTSGPIQYDNKVSGVGLKYFVINRLEQRTWASNEVFAELSIMAVRTQCVPNSTSSLPFRCCVSAGSPNEDR